MPLISHPVLQGCHHTWSFCALRESAPCSKHIRVCFSAKNSGHLGRVRTSIDSATGASAFQTTLFARDLVATLLGSVRLARLLYEIEHAREQHEEPGKRSPR